MADLFRFLVRYPFTLAMLAALIAAGIYGRTHVGELDENVRHRAGYSVRLLLEGELHRGFTSLFFTAGGTRFYSSLVMLAVAVGWVESSYGTLRAVTAFFGVHLATLVLMSVSIALLYAMAQTHRGSLLWEVKDVGPSAGYYGCLGFAIAGLSPGLRLSLVAAVASILLVRLAWSSIHLPEGGHVLSADIAHLIAFPMGLLLFLLLPAAER